MPNEQYLSMIQFYNYSFSDSKRAQVKYISNNVISPNTFNYDHLRITAMTLIPKTKYLIIAAENYGIIFIDMFKLKVINSVSLISSMRY